MSSDLSQWLTRRYRRDLLLGAGLVGMYAASVAAAVDTLDPIGTHDALVARVIAATLAAAGLIALVLLRTKFLQRDALVVFPVLVLTGSAVLGTVTGGIAPTFSGFFALAMIYAGLALRRRYLPVLLLTSVTCWLVSQDAMIVTSWVRLAVLIVVWATSSFALASHAGRERAEALDWVTRANEDPLTGLKTKRALTDWIDHALADSKHSPMHLVLIDLDGFKNVNDLYGHAAGDAVLIETARRMRRTLRSCDVTARLGGDEFAVVLVETDAIAARATTERLLAGLAEPVELPQGYMAVTASIGVTDLDAAGGADSALREADLAMYDAKRTGKNQVAAYRRELSQHDDSRGHREIDLLDAIDRDELELYYQPVVHLHTDRVIGVEALVRWNHPELGVLTPNCFLNAAEGPRSAIALNEWVLRRACSQTVAWQPKDRGAVLTLSVNVSAREMLAAGFVERLVAVLNETGLEAKLLVLEVTEGLVLSDAPLIRERIDLLRRIGVRIAIDDFGTGRSSLAELRSLPADIIKIAPTFTQALDDDLNATSMIKALDAIATALALDVIVEGVESELQRERLADLGCQLAQGYHLGRPQPAREIADLIERRRAFAGSPERTPTVS